MVVVVLAAHYQCHGSQFAGTALRVGVCVVQTKEARRGEEAERGGYQMKRQQRSRPTPLASTHECRYVMVFIGRSDGHDTPEYSEARDAVAPTDSARRSSQA